jgi:hypothetical protein
MNSQRRKGVTKGSAARASNTVSMRPIHLYPDETYKIGVDDHCFVVSSGNNPKAPKVWVSGSMVRWLFKNLIELV